MTNTAQTIGRRLGQAALLLAALGALAVLFAGPGTRLGLWDFRNGFQLMRYGVYTALGGAGVAWWAWCWAARGPGRRRRWWWAC